MTIIDQIRAVQRKHGLNDDGVAGALTWEAIYRSEFGNPILAAPVNVTGALASLLAIAGNEVGTKEVGGNNRGPRVQEYQRATDLEGTGWAWCAAFQCWIIREWLKSQDVRDALSVADAEAWRPVTAGAFDFIRWAKSKGLSVISSMSVCKAGDIVVFDFGGHGHIGIVEQGAEVFDDSFRTIEGNTNGRGDRDSESGDGVWRKVRERRAVRNFIRLIQ